MIKCISVCENEVEKRGEEHGQRVIGTKNLRGKGKEGGGEGEKEREREGGREREREMMKCIPKSEP